MTTQEELGIRLKQLGIRVTPQRLAIAEVVINSGDHPSVKDVFERVKAFFPYVTLATVYATLDLLERAAIVRELPFQRQSRYDANLSPHANLVCVGCGAVVDAAALRTNVLTSRAVQCAKLPMDFETDAEAIRAMLASLPDSDPAKARVVRIRDTLSLGTLEVSAALDAEVAAHPAVEPLGQVEPMQFDESGNLAELAL